MSVVAAEQESSGAAVRARRRLTGLTLVVMAVVGLLGWRVHQQRTAAELLHEDPAKILDEPALLARAVLIGRPLYQQHCARCHGAALQGDQVHGVPDLARNVWLYGNDPVSVERTIYYGIRSGHPKARNVTDMPAMVRSGQITQADATDTVEYLLSLAGSAHDEAAASRGRAVFYNQGNCFDCHANDAMGIVDYGTPALTGPTYVYGGDRKSLYWSIANGRHGLCPAWVKVLSPVQLRALTLFLVNAAAPVAQS
jgi:cytochrome c oxidase cbb3-type subunit III